MSAIYKDKQIFSWALYDWANSAYATVVIAGFFPVFFKEYWSTGVDTGTSTFYLGLSNSVSSLIIVLLAPLLGAIADQAGARKGFLLFFAALGMVMCGSLYFVQSGQWQLAVLLYIVASIGFMGGNIFYDALITVVTKNENMDRVSALGFSLGYLGGGVLFSINVLMVLYPETFGLADSSEAIRLSFIMVAFWWMVFSLPLFLFVKETKNNNYKRKSVVSSIIKGVHQLTGTFHHVRRLRVVFLFLLAYWLYIDGVDTIIRMAVDYGMALGFPAQTLMVALLITQFVGFPAALLFGKLGETWGTKKGIFLAIFIYMGVTTYGYFMDQVYEFYVLAVVIGLVQGGVQSLSRSFYARIIPANKSAEFFGFYNMLGKFAAVLGPVMMGWVSMATGEPRLSILSLLILFGFGALLLYFVNEEEGVRQAQFLQD
ncbi:MAG: MFS transporter [Gammaproteobacteria bacterium]|nr:MFS transporter [Gammaproteobacteria bacterium]